MNFIIKILAGLIGLFVLTNLTFCKKNKFNTDQDAVVQFSQDSVIFDTVFTSIGSATQNFRVRNTGKQKIKISSIYLAGGKSSPFIINVDGAKGTTFDDIEIAGNDSIYVFVQVNVNPTNASSPMIISDQIVFITNGNEQKVNLEAWGQDAYYHKPSDALYFKDGSYLAYSYVNEHTQAYTLVGSEYIWKNDKPHVVYGYLVVDSAQHLRIPEGTKVYMNYKAGIWVLPGGQIQVLGKKGNEVVFQGVRREKDFADDPGQWDRIWINEGSEFNKIDYAIIKNGYIGVQAEQFGQDTNLIKFKKLTITNTKIQNMSMWGLYGLYYNIIGGNNVISNCQEHSVNFLLGGYYEFYHCTFANYWKKDKPREKPTLNINNYSEGQTLPLVAYFGNCIIDGKLDNELTLDIKPSTQFPVTYTFSSCWIKTSTNTSDATKFMNIVKGTKTSILEYKDIDAYDFEPKSSETRIKNFTSPDAQADAQLFPQDINGVSRNTANVTAGAYEVP
ncbi:MAG: hypothetical protein JNL60_12005 [Bacteroidia bacterium]|nr:hypothetical protein [Bacteroidia bacterium]